ncbi:MAG: DUF4387 domain-containing protein [Candidatus Bathyarchaeia archaeon]
MKLGELASIMRSKNAGPFMLSIDIIFNSWEIYERVKKSGLITKDGVAKIYGVSESAVHGVFFIDQGYGIKVSLIKKIPSGAIECTDTFGAQHHIPLRDLEIP